MGPWFLLGTALVIGTFGLITIFSLIVSVLLFCIVGLVTIRHVFHKESDAWWLSLHCSNINRTYISEIANVIEREKVVDPGDRRITGSLIIDEQLNFVIKYLIRDFLTGWYATISGHPEFVVQVQLSLQEVLIGVSDRFKSTDWVGYLTTQFVDDLASHLHLFREAKAAVKSKKNGSSKDIVEHFFDREAEREKDICRDNICLNKDAEIDYLSDLVEILLYFCMPSDEFANIPLRSAIVEALVSVVFLPFVNQLSHPDYVNSLIVWSGSDFPVHSELYLSVIRTTTSTDELNSVRKLVVKEISHLRSRDSGGREQGNEAKQQIGSLEYLRQVIDTQLNRLDKGTETDSIGLPMNFDYRQLSRGKLFQLPLEAILKNSLTLDHFLRYMDSINCQHYVNLYLNIECWKASVSEHLCVLELERIHNLQEAGVSDSLMPDICHDYFTAHYLTSHKDEAEVIYELYMSEKANPRVAVDDSIVKRLILTLRSETITESWFDEIQHYLFVSLRDIDMFLPAFKRSDWYIRLLAELDLLKDVSKFYDDDAQSLEDISVSGSDQANDCSSCNPSPSTSHNPSPCHTRTSSLSNRPYTIFAYIPSAEIVREGNRSHAVYRTNVQRKDQTGFEEIWHVFRRYSEFHDFHITICTKFMDLSCIPFPSKKMLNNLAAWFLEKRMSELNYWLSRLLDPPVIQSHPGLQDQVFSFLDQSYQTQSGNLTRKVQNTFVAPIRLGVRSVSDAVKSVPGTVDGMVDGIRKLVRPTHQTKCAFSSDPPVLAYKGSIDIEGEENIPLRILLLLMDEVFDLGSKDQWFRRRIILFLRQILKAMFGDIVNRRIIDYVGYITSSEQVAEYIRLFKDSIWPGGKLASPPPERDKDAQLRTMISARTCLLASISDEFKAILGSQTTSRGILNVYECVQWQPLNKRLIYVLLTGIIESVFITQRQMPDILKSLISSSNRKLSKPQPNIAGRDGRYSN